MNISADQLVYFIILALSFIISLSFHELAHAWLADRFGDPTPRAAGRVTLNPLAHLDPIGLIALFLFRFGWAKPVPVNPRNFQNPITDEIQVALAGPFANLAIAVIAGLMAHLPVGASVFQILAIVVQLNLTLMIFNLLPIPPLDGSRILQLFIPYETYLMLERMSLIFLFALFFYGGGLIARIYDVTIDPLMRVLLG